MSNAVTILSGGLDSTTLAFHVADEGIKQHFLSFNYGQKHKKELRSAKKIAKLLGCKHDIINLSKVGPFLKGSALTDSTSVSMPEGYYAEENMRLTVVPNRNAIMLSVAWGVAIGEQAEAVYYGAHGGDHEIYEDCRPEFISALGQAFKLGTHGNFPFVLSAPFSTMTKADIIKLGIKLKVPFKKTWTCYQGGKLACGTCGSCTERLHSFHLAGIEDPIKYTDREYWKKAVLERVSA